MDITQFWAAWQRTHAVLEQDAEWLGSAGWTIPLWREPDILRELRQVPLDHLDTLFVQHYTAHRGANLQRVCDELLTSHGLAHWHTLLSEAVVSYRARRYAIVVTALLAILEGAIAMATQDLKRKSDPKGATARKRKGTEKGMRRLIWVSIEAFAREVFRPVPFSDRRPTIVNRNWVLHGRDTSSWSRVDCIRLFHALHTTMVTVDRVR